MQLNKQTKIAVHVNMSSVKCNIYDALVIIIMEALILFLWLLNTRIFIIINYPL